MISPSSSANGGIGGCEVGSTISLIRSPSMGYSPVMVNYFAAKIFVRFQAPSIKNAFIISTNFLKSVEIKKNEFQPFQPFPLALTEIEVRNDF